VKNPNFFIISLGKRICNNTLPNLPKEAASIILLTDFPMTFFLLKTIIDSIKEKRHARISSKGIEGIL